MHPTTRLAARLIAIALSFPVTASAAPSITALPDAAVTPVRHAINISVLANDTADEELCVASVGQARNGRVQITGNAKRVRYTPNKGFSGLDTFTYVAETESGARQRARVTVAVGQGDALRLRGNVLGARRGKTRVHAQINGFEFVTHSDARGRYTLDVATLDGTGFVTLHADATASAGIALDLSSAVGEFGRLVLEAGADGSLIQSENHQVIASPLSTALVTLLASASGSVPASDLALRRGLQSLNTSELLELTAVIRLLASGQAELPPDALSILELIQNPEQLAAFEAGLPPGQLDAEVEAIHQDPELLPDFDASNLNPAYALVEPGAPGTVRIGRTVGRLGALYSVFPGAGSGTAAGTGRAIVRVPNPDPGTNWQIDAAAGDVDVAFASPLATTRLEPTTTCPGTPQRLVVRSVLGHRLERLVDGPGFDHVTVVTTTLVEFPDRPDLGCQPVPSRTEEARGQFLAFETGGARRGEIPYFAPGAQYGLALYAGGSAPLDPWEYELYDFASTPSSPATWQLVDGHLLVQQPRGGPTEYMRLLDDGAKGDGVLALATLPDGTQSVEYFLGVERDGSLEFDESNAAAAWRSGTFISRLPGTPPESETVLVLEPGGTGRDQNVGADGACGIAPPVTWSLVGEELVTVRATVPFALTLRWTPIARAGSRIYVLEDRTLIDRRIRGHFHDAVDFVCGAL